MTLTEGQQVNITEPGRIRVVPQVEGAGTGAGLSGRDTVREFSYFGLGRERQATKVHSQNAAGVAGLRGATEDEGRGSLGRGEGKFFFDEIALGVGSVGVEVRVMAEAVLVAGCGEGKIGNARFAEWVSAREDRERRGERRVERRRRRWLIFGCLVVTLNP